MNITIFGGTGETGLLVVKRILEKGYNATVFARTPSKITFTHEHLSVVKGEISDYNAIEPVIKTANAVISILGPTGKMKGLPVSSGLKNIIAAMGKNNVRRLIATATPSYQDANDKYQLSFHLAIFMIKKLQGDVYEDIQELGKAVTASQLDWTLVRLPMLSNKPAKGKINAGYTGNDNVSLFSLTREDLADFLVKQIEDKEFIRKAPVISN